MSLQYVLLGLLHEPASGYDLKYQFQQSVRHFWAAELAQIYPLLARMEQQGLLRSQRQPSTQGPPRKVYSRTVHGTRALGEWLLQGPELRTERLSWLAQVFFLAEITPAQRRAFFRRLREDFTAHLEELQQVEAQWRSEDPRYPDGLDDAGFYPQLTLRLGLLKYHTIIQWCDECLRRLARREAVASNSDSDNGR